MTNHLRFGGQELVLRKKPPGKLLRGAHMIEREYQVMKALGTAGQGSPHRLVLLFAPYQPALGPTGSGAWIPASGVPVPECLALCEDESVCGTPFYIMRYIHGRVFKNAALAEVPKEQRKEIYLGMFLYKISGRLLSSRTP